MSEVQISELVGALVRGSDELNRMKREIKTVVNVLLGIDSFAKFLTPLKSEWRSHRIECSYGARGVEWLLSRFSGKIQIELFEHSSGLLLYANDSGHEVRYVARVYDALPSLVDDLLFRKVIRQEDLAPYLEAAKRVA